MIPSFSHVLAAVAVPAFGVMMAAKGVALYNGPCSAGPTVQSTNSTLLGRLWSSVGCLPSPGREPVAFAVVTAGEMLALPVTGMALAATGVVYWIYGGRRVFSSLHMGPSSQEGARRDLCAIQRRLVPDSPAAEPPTLFEYLDLDASRAPFVPANECATSDNKNHAPAIRAIHDAAVHRYKVLFPLGLDRAMEHNQQTAEAEFDTFISIVRYLLDDSHRNEYLVSFLPVLAGPSLNIGIDNAKGRRAAIDAICWGKDKDN